MTELSLEGHRAIVTGAGRGIGRAHALELAGRGAAVVVNDVDREAADSVVAQIVEGGGAAVASYAPVGTRAAGEEIVARALDELGGIEIVVNNAGFLRPALFEDMTDEQLRQVLDVHLMGSIYVTQAAWRTLKAQRYGRVVLTSSSAAMFGLQGQANYCAAKAGTFGVMKALSYEGASHGIRVNALLPYAASAITDQDPIPNIAEEYARYIDAELGAKLAAANREPERVSPMMLYLASPACELTGEAFSICAGRYARVVVGVTEGWLAPADAVVSGESVAEHLEQISALGNLRTPAVMYEEVADVARRL